jgi:hypothetical protein
MLGAARRVARVDGVDGVDGVGLAARVARGGMRRLCLEMLSFEKTLAFRNRNDGRSISEVARASFFLDAVSGGFDPWRLWWSDGS